MWMRTRTFDFCDDTISRLRHSDEHGELDIYSDDSGNGLRLVVSSQFKSFQYVPAIHRPRAFGPRHLGNFPSRTTEEARALAGYFARQDDAVDNTAVKSGPSSAAGEIGLLIWTFALCAEAYLASDVHVQKECFFPDKQILRAVILGRGYERKDRHFAFDRRWTEKPLADVTSDDVSAFIRRIRDVYGSCLARRCLSIIKGTFALASRVAHRGPFGLEHDPVAALGESITQMDVPLHECGPTRLRSYLLAAERLPLARDRILAKTLALTGLPARDLARWRWSTIPGTPLRGGVLSDAVVALLDELRASTRPAADDPVFGDKGKPFKSFGKLKSAIERESEHLNVSGEGGMPFPTWSTMNLRRSVRSLLHAGGLCSRAVNAATGIYSRTDFMLDNPFYRMEIRKALAKHAENLAALVAGHDVDWRR
ncbi:hypothetical protein [Rhizobium leguminosarum]|uniref:hypothetical protein n=1 Tax=Rhizobium leguminosarum TaxID=384 RepID=UPI000DE55628